MTGVRSTKCLTFTRNIARGKSELCLDFVFLFYTAVIFKTGFMQPLISWSLLQCLFLLTWLLSPHCPFLDFVVAPNTLCATRPSPGNWFLVSPVQSSEARSPSLPARPLLEGVCHGTGRVVVDLISRHFVAFQVGTCLGLRLKRSRQSLFSAGVLDLI